VRVPESVEIRRRLERLLKRVERRDAYGELLAKGHTIVRLSEIEDVDAWRAEIRRQARADRIKIRTGVNDTIVWALLAGKLTTSHEQEHDRYMRALQEAVPRAAVLRHEPSVLLRDGDETVCGCERCAAVGLIDTGLHGLIGGSLFEDECPYESPPRPTALTVGF
jgi:hypothetical protein